MWLLHSMMAILAHLVAFIKQLHGVLRRMWEWVGRDLGLPAYGNFLWARKHWLAPGPVGTPEAAAAVEAFGLFPSQLSNNVQESRENSRGYWYMQNCHGTDTLGLLTTRQHGNLQPTPGPTGVQLTFPFFCIFWQTCPVDVRCSLLIEAALCHSANRHYFYNSLGGISFFKGGL